MPAHPTPDPRRRAYDLADLVEDLAFSLMLFAGAAITLTILVLILFL